VRVSTYDKIAWLPLCAGLTGLGLVLSYLAYRRRGAGSGLRWAAWSLLPIAAYLTGSVEMFWKMGVAVGDFAKGFAFSPRVWAGIALAGLAVVLFVVSGPVRRRRVGRGQDRQAAESGSGGTRALPQNRAAAGGGQLATRPAATVPAAGAAQAPAKGRKAKNADDEDDDLGDVADILRRHGIT
jgi:membrane protein implicated in regulation of membrane protease activity